MNRKKTEYEVKKFGAGGCHIIVPRKWLGLKIKIVIEENNESKSINEILE